jgi:uncharacterized RDD family membrane protein YckC
MMATIFLFFLALLAAATFAVPGLAPVGMLLFFFIFAAAVWWFGLAVSTRGEPSEALVRTKRHHLLGPGGPDDPFAGERYEDE